MSALSDRIRGIVAPRRTAGSNPLDPRDLPDPPDLPDLRDRPDPLDLPGLAATLGGSWVGGSFVVDRRWDPSARHGREGIGELAARLEQSADHAALFTGAAGGTARPPFVFFDLETTGLSGGAGTLAFLVGCGRFEADGAFVTRQYLLTKFSDERALLETVGADLMRAGALVSFNGKSFDAPLLESRFLFHRLAWPGGALPHIDALHPARRLWKQSSPKGLRDVPGAEPLVAQSFRPAPATESGCSLQTLERQQLGLRRVGDVPGFEIPARYFQFVRGGDPRPLEAILEHNRLDLLTLATLTSRLLHLAGTGPAAASDAREALALGHIYLRGGFDDRAMAAYRHALARCRSPRGAYDPIRIDALRAVALGCRRARRYDEAASHWSELLAMRGCPAPAACEATEALAIHHEHRRRDLTAAKTFALLSLETGSGPGWTSAARYRLARIERKLEESAVKPLF